MRERAISQNIINQAIKYPDKIEGSTKNKYRFLVKKVYFNKKLKRDHLLLIIYEIKRTFIEVITVIDTSKISKYF